MQEVPFTLPADKSRRLALRAARTRLQQAPGLDRAFSAPHCEVAERREEKAAFQLACGRAADHDRARLGGALEASSDVHRVPESHRMPLGDTDDADRNLA